VGATQQNRGNATVNFEKQLEKIKYDIENLKIKERLLKTFESSNTDIENIEVENSMNYNTKITIQLKPYETITLEFIEAIKNVLSEFGYKTLYDMEITYITKPFDVLTLRLWF